MSKDKELKLHGQIRIIEQDFLPFTNDKGEEVHCMMVPETKDLFACSPVFVKGLKIIVENYNVSKGGEEMTLPDLMCIFFAIFGCYVMILFAGMLTILLLSAYKEFRKS